MPGPSIISRNQSASVTERTIWRELVRLQDRLQKAGQGVDGSHDAIAAKFKVSVATVKAIEESGIAQDWPLPG